MQQKKTGWLQSWFGVQDMTIGRPMDSLNQGELHIHGEPLDIVLALPD